jgi:hypothetical protein
MRRYAQIVAIGATLLQGTLPEGPSVSNLLDLYRANQDKARSFYAKTEDIAESTDSAKPGSKFTHTVSEIRVDGDKIDYRTHVWRGLGSEVKDTPMDQAILNSSVWDGESLINYRKTNIGIASIKRNKIHRDRMVSITCGGARLTGILETDLEPVDSILREAATVSVEERMDEVDGFQCYVISAVSRHGSYRVWINPERGYNIAKAEVKKKGGDLAWDKRLDFKPNAVPGMKSPPPAMESFSFTMKNVLFENVDNVWIPMEADWDSVFKYEDGSVTQGHNHHKRTEITLNPDHDAMGSFVPDIPDGTRVIVEGSSGVKYTWFGGRAIGDVDAYVVEELDEVVEQEIAAASPNKQHDVPNEGEVGASDTRLSSETEGTEIQPASTGGRASRLGVFLGLLGLLLTTIIGWRVLLRIRGRIHAKVQL